MNRRSSLKWGHILDSILLVCFAAAGSALLIQVLYPATAGAIQNVLGGPSAWLPPVAVVVFVMLFVFVAAIAPFHLLSAVSALRYFPNHLGLAFRCWAGGCLCIVLLWLTRFPGLSDYAAVEVLFCVAAYTVLLAAGSLVGGPVAWALRSRHALPEVASSGAPGNGTSDRKTDFRAWLTDDQPIRTADENLLPSHLDTARRMLNRLIRPQERERAPSCNMALVGPHGSGKTSICKLVSSEYARSEHSHPDWPHLLFCWFEAWRYLTPEAALRGLIDAAAGRVLEEVDECCLWSLGEQYVQAAQESGLGWARVAALLLGGSREPDALLGRLSELLCRLNQRLVVFVDDLDRVEATSPDQQQAIVRALNQFQTAANVHYVIAVGPAHWASPERAARQPLLDLLKLTRFQEPVPDLVEEEALAVVRELRDEARSDNSTCHPWAVADEEDDCLMADKWRRYLSVRTWGYATLLLEFLKTPRQVKQALRDTRTAWRTGLDGEINWYHLLLANALKAAEPGVFEWILRDKDTFLISKAEFGPKKEEEREQEAERLRDRLKAALQVESDDRHEALVEAFNLLFPVFAKKIHKDPWTPVEPRPWMQDLAADPARGQSYFHRFGAGGVPAGDLPDRPALEYVKSVREDGFDAEVFEEVYLESPDKLTGPLNKIVQFGRFLGGGNVLAACDTILEWASRPKSIQIWPEPRWFYITMCGDIDGFLTQVEVPDLQGWARRKVEEIGRRSPLLAWNLIKMLESGSGPAMCIVDRAQADQLRRLWAETVADEFVTGSQPLGPVVDAYPFALARLLAPLDAHPNYDKLKPILTRKLIDEAERSTEEWLKREIALALPQSATCSAMSGPVPPEDYKFTYDKKLNKKQFDMPILRPVLEKWHAEGVGDPLARRVLRELAQEYGFGSAPSSS